MNIHLDTKRLVFRDIEDSDLADMYALDSDSEVHRYLGGKPIKNLEEAQRIINNIRQQYVDNGIGRWAVIDKKSGDFIGWGGE